MAYTKTLIRQFKGLSQNLALTSGKPEFALDCVNVIPSVAGLAKLCYPVNLSPAVGGTGPDQFAMFEGGITKAILGFFGSDIYVYTLDDFNPAIFDSNPQYNGPVPWSTVLSNNFAFLQNGLSTPIKYTGTVLKFWGAQVGGVPTIGVPFGTGITLTDGRQYRASYEDGSDFVVGTASPASASTGPIVNQTIPVTIPAPAVVDGYLNTARLYATFDGGSDYFLHSVVVGVFPLTINDDKPDDALDQSERAPLINAQPPKALYTCLWGGRIFMFNLPDENPKWVAYTGYNRIFVGRPEETCPPGNRIKLETGADDIAGGGVIAAGVVAFDRSNKMFMFRGQPEDITVTAPVEFTLFLKQLPWQIGCGSHFTIQSTQRGLVWLTHDLDVMLFDGQSEPVSIDEGVEPILRSINLAQLQNSRSVYWKYKGRNWYILAVAVGSSSVLNKILIFDLEENQDKNVGCFPIDIGEFQSLGMVETYDGSQKLVIGQAGILKELLVTSTTINGIDQDVSATAATLGAFWQSGYVGNESPELEKFFRWFRVTADQQGIRVKRRLITNDIRNPSVIEFVDLPIGGKLGTNKKARRISYELRFRDEDVSQNILELLDVNVAVAER